MKICYLKCSLPHTWSSVIISLAAVKQSCTVLSCRHVYYDDTIPAFSLPSFLSTSILPLICLTTQPFNGERMYLADKVLAGTQISFSSTSCYLFYGYGVMKEIGFHSCWHAQWLPEFTAYNTEDLFFDCSRKWRSRSFSPELFLLKLTVQLLQETHLYHLENEM